MYTAHAIVRMQRRAISSSVVNLLLDYGERTPAGRSGEIFYFGKRGRRRVLHSKRQDVSRRLEGHWRDYVVVADGQVVTCGKRYRRIRRAKF